MKDSFFESSFAKQCRFDYDFITTFKDRPKWEILSRQYNNINNNNINNNNLKSNNFNKIIPKKIHQIWIGKRKLPKKYLNWMKTWKTINSDWEYNFWDDKKIKELNFKNQDLYDSSNNVGFKSDIARYEILNQFGGLYVDTDLECIKKIPEHFRNFDYISCIVFDNSPQIANGVIFAKPNAKINSNVMKNILKSSNEESALDILNCSGANLITREYFKLEKEERDKILILPSNYFYPIPNFIIGNESDKEKFITKETIGIHYWEVSWMKGNLIKRIVEKLLKIINKFLDNLKN